jgi:hypothetical protein
MKNFDKLFFGAILGFAFPFLFALIAMMIWFYVSKNEAIALNSLLAGVSVGALTDVVFLKKWITHRYELSKGFLIFLFVVYNIGIYGMFMGFPLFNLIMGLVAGYYVAKRAIKEEIPKDKASKLMHSVSLFTSLVMAVMCISSTILVFGEKVLSIDLKPMIGIDFVMSHGLINGITIIGGLFLIALQYLITKLTIKRTLIVEWKS